MKIGLCIDPRLGRTWDEALDLAVQHGIEYVEPAGGGHVPTHHVDPVMLVQDLKGFTTFRDSIESRGLSVAALGCYGNPLHPDGERATAFHRDFVAMCSLASKLGVRRITVISGLPGGGPLDRVPNWINLSVFADLENAYRWQWDERLIPYWRSACALATDHGVTVCMEPIGNNMIHTGETFLRLADACGETLQASIDPSHLWWQGIDPCVAVSQLAGRIGFVQLKDVAFDAARIARDGLMPACNYDDWNARTWVYRAIGFGHDEMFWQDFLTALRRSGYDDVAAIELEESWMTMDEALEKSVDLVRRAMPRDAIPTRNWFSGYEWVSARIE